MQDVIVPDDQGTTFAKFIVAVMKDGYYKKIVFRAPGGLGMHSDVLAKLEEECELKFCSVLLCLGGGKIDMDRDRKTIHLHDYSTDFGFEPDRDQTAKMLQKVFPDFQITWDASKPKMIWEK